MAKSRGQQISQPHPQNAQPVDVRRTALSVNDSCSCGVPDTSPLISGKAIHDVVAMGIMLTRGGYSMKKFNPFTLASMARRCNAHRSPLSKIVITENCHYRKLPLPVRRRISEPSSVSTAHLRPSFLPPE